MDQSYHGTYEPTEQDIEALAADRAEQARATSKLQPYEIVYTHPVYKTQESISTNKMRDGRFRLIYRGAMAMNMEEPIGPLVSTHDEAIAAADRFAASRGWK